MGRVFFMECYNPVGEMMDMLALENSAANFLLYCLMSTQFRATIRKILGIQQKRSRGASTQVEVNIAILFDVFLIDLIPEIPHPETRSGGEPL
jgi:hypothetical protein